MSQEIEFFLESARPGTVHAWRVPESHCTLLPVGPWNDEPTKVQWIDAATGLPCLIVRNNLGNLCGYAGVEDSHRFFGVHYDGVDVDVHGGLTYSDFCQPSGDESRGVCHVPEPGSADHVWWLGFDCAHSGDLTPYLVPNFDNRPRSWETYKDVSYVAAEVTNLAAQLAEAA